MLMNKILDKVIVSISAVALLFIGSCGERDGFYSDAEYIMFADTAKAYAVLDDGAYISVPVVATTISDHDRVLGVEIIDSESTAVENLHYSIESNTLVIPAGSNRADVHINGKFDKLEAGTNLSVTLELIIPDELEFELYGRRTRVDLVKCCPFDINNFTGWCVFSSTFLQNYSITGQYQRLVRTEVYPNRPNTIICRNLFKEGYDVTLTFDDSDPLNPVVTLEEGQTASDEASFFGTVHGDNRILVRTSAMAPSYFNSCGIYMFVWMEMYVKDLSETVGTVGHFYNVLEWVSDEEMELLKSQGMPV